MDKATDIITSIYRPAVERHFEHHPLRDVIMQAYDRGDAPPEQWDLWYAEAEAIGWQRLKALGDKQVVSEAGTVTFPIFREDS